MNRRTKVATLGLSEADRKAVEDFKRDVIDPSHTELVIVDFWAEWCGPCKQLAPVIEKVCADYAPKGVRLVKVNVDENGFIASQFRVQSIPTVYAVFKGQPVADLSQHERTAHAGAVHGAAGQPQQQQADAMRGRQPAGQRAAMQDSRTGGQECGPGFSHADSMQGPDRPSLILIKAAGGGAARMPA